MFFRVMSQMFEDIEGVEIIVDDILIWGENKQQHDDKVYSTFLPSGITLRTLLEKDAAWQWQHEHEQSLLRLKELAISAPVLPYFKPN